jgi:DNA-directed RNA polymerase I subunit RPA49
LQNIRDRRNDLGQTFGTKKARNAIASLTENAISPSKNARQASLENAPHEELDSTTKAILSSIKETTDGIATHEELSATVDNSKPCPKANLAAENIEDVYTIESVIGVEILKLVPVKEWLDAVKAKKEVVTNSRFVARRLQNVAADVQRLKILRYLLCLLEFFRAAQPKGREVRIVPRKEGLRSALPGIPEAVVEGIRRKFSINGQMKKYEVDFLMTHICVLALLVDNFEVDVYDLMEDLQLEVKKITQYFREIGAKVVGPSEAERNKLRLDKAVASQHKFARLRLPLVFPKTRFVKNR